MPERKGEDFDKDQGLGSLVKGFGDLLTILTDALDAGAGTAPASSKAQSLREPLVDVFDEGTEIVVVAELPGVTANDVRVEVQDDVLTLTTTGSRAFATDVLLPAPVRVAAWQQQFRNGILEVRLPKA